MTGRVNLDLGTTTEEKLRRMRALRQLAALTGAYGRNGGPSVSELDRLIADAFEYAPEPVADLMQQIVYLAKAARAVAGEIITEEAMSLSAVYYVQTSDPAYVVRVPSREEAGDQETIELIPSPGNLEFGLANPLGTYVWPTVVFEAARRNLAVERTAPVAVRFEEVVC